MKTLPQLLDQHQITAHADRLEFEELVHVSERSAGAQIQAAQMAFDAALAEKLAEADTIVSAARESAESAQASLAALQVKTSAALKTAGDAIANPKLSPKATVAAVAAVIEALTKSDKDREREALEAQQAEIAARLAALG